MVGRVLNTESTNSFESGNANPGTTEEELMAQAIRECKEQLKKD